VISDFINEGGQLPSAIFAVNDYSAIGCVEALKMHGICVPKEVSVIGCDDIDIAEFLSPSLTTIKISFGSMGRMAVEMLLDIIRNDSYGTVKRISGNIVIRDSCYVSKQ
jgi:LacI family purine nucleotide synthesis repressor